MHHHLTVVRRLAGSLCFWGSLFCFFLQPKNAIGQNCPDSTWLANFIVEHESCPNAADGRILFTNNVQGSEFSLDNITFTNLTSFDGLGEGNYSVYARLVANPNCADTFHTEIKADTIKPYIDCVPHTVQLNSQGKAVVPVAFLLDSLSDNCTPTADIDVSIDELTFDCGDAGTNQTFTITAEDAQGNSISCNSLVTIRPFSPCTPSASISTSCACKNNATTFQNGQFSDTITVSALAGQAWKVAAVQGFFRYNSPAPPASPIPIAAGTSLQFVAPNTYQISGLHTDSMGYMITVQNSKGDSFQLSNFCTYPTPVFNLPKDTFCFGSASILLMGQAGDSDPDSTRFYLDGNQISIFNPTQISTGQHILTYAVFGGQASSTDTSNAGCYFAVSDTFAFTQTSSDVVCNNLVQISLPATCFVHVQPDQILEGDYGCYDDFTVELFDNGVFTGNLIDQSHLGKTLEAKVTHIPSGNFCDGGQISVEDKLPPTITCEDITVSAATPDLSPNYLKNQLQIAAAVPHSTENCGTASLDFLDQIIFDSPCDSPFNHIVQRVWTATDNSGNFSTCSQRIFVKVVQQTDVFFPVDKVLNCQSFDTTVTATGVPRIVFNSNDTMPLFPQTGMTTLYVSYSDEMLPICDGTRKVLRTWSVTDWCKPIVINVNPKKLIQVIKIEDIEKPRMICPENLTISTGFDTCTLIYDLPDLLLSDYCSRLTNFKARYVLPDSSLHELVGLLGPTGINSTEFDTLGILGNTDELPQGTTKVTYYATDDCGNVGSCTFNVSIVDDVPPIPLCTPSSKVSLGLNGKASVPAQAYNIASYDNCSPVQFKVRRKAANNCQDHTKFHDKVDFCCVDVRDTMDIVFRVYDVAVPKGSVDLTTAQAHANDCFVSVIVEDNLVPTCQPPPDVTVDCMAFDATLWSYGTATGTDNCNLTVTTSTVISHFDTLCNIGELVRVFTVSDSGGATNTCTQTVSVTGNQEFYVHFPDDEIITECSGNSTVIEPEIYFEDCELIGISHTDDTLTAVQNGCARIDRTWRVVNWCNYDSTNTCADVPNPNPVANLTSPQNLPGPLISKHCDQNDPFAASLIAVYPGQPPFQYCTLYDSLIGCYEYTQTILIIDGERPSHSAISLPDPCDLSENDAAFWASNFWWDPINATHNLSEKEVELSIMGFDSCSGNQIEIHYQLSMDLDQDGNFETVVNSF